MDFSEGFLKSIKYTLGSMKKKATQHKRGKKNDPLKKR